MKVGLSLPLLLVALSVSCCVWAHQRGEKILPVFQVVRFPNDPCAVSSSAGKNGTCYTTEECSSKGGVSGGSCASGFGVCCIFTFGCGGTTNENCTYFDSASTVAAGACRAQVCKCSTDICQIRLDFNSFVITGPSTDTNTIAKFINGAPVGGDADAAYATRCLTDTFSVTNQDTLPQICGTNTGQHVYFDASESCHDLNFQLGQSAVGTSLATRTWSIKITQYSCNYENLAPSGCDQYYYGPGAVNTVQTFNYDGGKHLADQSQTICVRREAGNCRICWSADAKTDVQTSNIANMASIGGSKCCGYGADGVQMLGWDCIMIPGAEDTAGANKPQTLCGHSKGLFTAAASDTKTVCSRSQPFRITFQSDHFEWKGAKDEANAPNKGFKVRYFQTACP